MTAYFHVVTTGIRPDEFGLTRISRYVTDKLYVIPTAFRPTSPGRLELPLLGRGPRVLVHLDDGDKGTNKTVTDFLVIRLM